AFPAPPEYHGAYHGGGCHGRARVKFALVTERRLWVTMGRGDRSVTHRRTGAHLAALILWSFALGARADQRPQATPKTRALLLNGGGSASSNSLSHLHHLQDRAQALRHRGLAPDSIDVFSADGEDPKPDLVARGSVQDEFWLIEGTPLGAVLRQNEVTNTVWE